MQAQARAREEARATWKQCFGREPTPFVVEELARRFASMGFDDGLLSVAIRAAAWSGANSPMAFICTTLVDWRTHHVKTQEDVDEYLTLLDMERGKMGPVAQWDAAKRIEEFTEDRETPEERESREKWKRRREEEAQKQQELIEANKAARAANET